MPLRRRVFLIRNPVSGLRNSFRFAAIEEALRKTGARVDVQSTAVRGDAERLAAAIDPTAWDVLAVAGGDGTFNEVANGLKWPNLPIALIPLGTANVAAQELRLPRRTDELARMVLHGRPRKIFLPSANGRTFIMMAGVGFDAHVVAGVDLRFKRHLGRAAYVVPLVAETLRLGGPWYRVRIDTVDHEAAALIMANGACYAGSFRCAPDARLDDPLLHVCLFGNRRRRDVVRYLVALGRGTLANLGDVQILPARRVEVAACPRSEPVHCDGDITTSLPLVVEAAQRTITVLLPAADFGD
jgi:YegS/Rv2252/BmrU family lipid kinase